MSESESRTQVRTFTKGRATIINRVPVGTTYSSLPAGRSSMSMRMSTGLLGMTPGVYSNLSHEGVQGVKETRAKEKKEMQELNERFASYVDKVRYLESQNKYLEEVIEVLKNQKQADFQPVKDTYDSELKQARKVIEEMGRDKAETDSKNAGLQDELDSQGTLVDTLQRQARDYITKIDALTTQNGEYEGEVSTMRGRVENLEDEIAKLRELYARLQDENKRIRLNCDQATTDLIDSDFRLQGKQEEIDFLNDVLDKMPKFQDTTIKIKGMGPQDYWKGEIAKCIRDLQAEYELKLDQLREDTEIRQSAQLRQLQSGMVRDNMELQASKEEVSKLRSTVNDKGKSMADLEAKLAAAEIELREVNNRLGDTEAELDALRLRYSSDTASQRAEMEQILEELRKIQDAKLGMELEIACYRQLLEGEENRMGLRQLVDSAIGVQSRGGADLSQIIQQSNLGDAAGRVTVQRSSRGHIVFTEAAMDGSSIVIENTSSPKNPKHTNLGGWRIVRKMSSLKQAVEFTFPNVELRQGRSLKIFSKSHGSSAKGDDLVADCSSWGNGSGTTTLYDDMNAEKASMRATLVAM